jgi:hypothetical protein
MMGRLARGLIRCMMRRIEIGEGGRSGGGVWLVLLVLVEGEGLTVDMGAELVRKVGSGCELRWDDRQLVRNCLRDGAKARAERREELRE